MMLSTKVEQVHDGRRLRVARLGEGPPIVLLHGYPDNLQIWCQLAKRLSRFNEVIAFDWPGMGYSDAWPGGTTPIHQAERLLTLLDTWQIERANLVGMDMGGQPALAFAAKHPDRIGKLIVMNSLVLWDEKTSWEIRILRKFGWNQLILRRSPRTVFRRAERTFLPAGVTLPPELHSDLWSAFKRKEAREFIVRMCAAYQGTLPRLSMMYGQIDCPTLVLWAERDKHFPPEHARRLHTAISGSHLEIVRNAEHWMAWYLAEAVAENIMVFMK